MAGNPAGPTPGAQVMKGRRAGPLVSEDSGVNGKTSLLFPEKWEDHAIKREKLRLIDLHLGSFQWKRPIKMEKFPPRRSLRPLFEK
ncbi:hypothetical protein PUR_39540 [Paenibacillus sp. URB8-2]|nr:hypothetical protein PUR_39540 [Paenibacillus sp. URB8-2]